MEDNEHPTESGGALGRGRELPMANMTAMQVSTLWPLVTTVPVCAACSRSRTVHAPGMSFLERAASGTRAI